MRCRRAMSSRRPERLAGHWVPGTGQLSIERLSSGVVNQTFRVDRAGRRYSLRVAAARAAALGLDRGWECRVLGAAAVAGLAPAVVHCDPALGILVSEWVDGDVWTADAARAAANLEAMAGLLRRVHALAIEGPPRVLGPADWVVHYSRALAANGARPGRSAALRDAAAAHLALAAPEPLTVPCHSDLHRLNVVAGGRLLLLDWEYAHVSNPCWDLAGWAANNDWTERETHALLKVYLQRPPGEEECRRLHVWRWLYDYVCLLWCELYAIQRPGRAGRGAAARAVAARADLLAARLRDDA